MKTDKPLWGCIIGCWSIDFDDLNGMTITCRYPDDDTEISMNEQYVLQLRDALNQCPHLPQIKGLDS